MSGNLPFEEETCGSSFLSHHPMNGQQDHVYLSLVRSFTHGM
jgi:hypothetical protein